MPSRERASNAPPSCGGGQSPLCNAAHSVPPSGTRSTFGPPDNFWSGACSVGTAPPSLSSSVSLLTEKSMRSGNAPSCRVQGPGFRVQGSGSRVQGPGSRVQGPGSRVEDPGSRVQGPGFRVQGSGRRVQGAGCRVQGSGFRVQGSGRRVQGSGCRVQDSRVQEYRDLQIGRSEERRVGKE